MHTINLTRTGNRSALAKAAARELKIAGLLDLEWEAWKAAMRGGEEALERYLQGKVAIEWLEEKAVNSPL